MRVKCHIKLVVLASTTLALLVLALVWWAQIPDPRHKGRRLLEWLAIYTTGTVVQAQLDAWDAIEQLGPRSIPLLQSYLAGTDRWEPVRSNLERIGIKLKSADPKTLKRQALRACWVLGPTAEPLLPLLSDYARLLPPGDRLNVYRTFYWIGMGPLPRPTDLHEWEKVFGNSPGDVAMRANLLAANRLSAQWKQAGALSNEMTSSITRDRRITDKIISEFTSMLTNAWSDRPMIMGCMMDFQPSFTNALPVFLELALEKPMPHPLSEQAFAAAQHSDPDGTRVPEMLSTRLADPSGSKEMKLNAMELLRRSRSVAPVVLTTLESVKRDPDPALQRAATAVLAELRGPSR